MQAQLADGRILEFPDGTDPSVIQAAVKKVLGSQEIPEARIPTTEMARGSGFIKGLFDPAAGLGQLSEELAPTTLPPETVLAGVETKPISKYIKQEEDIYQQRRGDEGFDWARMGGNIASPATLPLMAAPIAQAPIRTGMAIGGVSAGAQPVTDGDFWTKKGEQAAIGTAFGGAVPLGIGLAKQGMTAIGQFFRPFSEKGIKKDVQDFLINIVGADRDKVINALQSAQGDETAQQVLGRAIREARARGETTVFGAKIAKLEDELQKSQYTQDLISAVKAKQAARREDVIGGIAKTPEDLKAAEALRTAAGERNYKDAFNVIIESDDKLAQIAKNPFLRDQIKEVDKIAKAKAARGEETSLTEYLHNIKLGLDSRLTIKAGDKGALDKAGKKEVGKLKSELVDWLRENNSLYEKARQEHMELSRPIERMQVGQELQKGLTKATEKESPATFLGAMREAPRTLKRATGEPRYTELEQVIPDDISSVKKVADELLNIQQGKTLAGQKAGSLSKIEGEVEPQLPHILSRPVVVANTILRMIGRDKTPEYQAILEDVVLNPKRLADYLSLPPTNAKRQMAMDIMKKMSEISVSQTAAREEGR